MNACGMTPSDSSPNIITSSRRDFLKTTSKIAAVSALAGVAIPHVPAQSSNEIRIALVGCGGRGGGAASNALSVKTGPTKLVAMADVFEAKLKGAFRGPKNKHGDQVDGPDDRKFIGFDGYKKAMNCLLTAERRESKFLSVLALKIKELIILLCVFSPERQKQIPISKFLSVTPM